MEYYNNNNNNNSKNSEERINGNCHYQINPNNNNSNNLAIQSDGYIARQNEDNLQDTNFSKVQPNCQQQSSASNGQQQFCLRWHNHQTSLLGTLPVMLDQCQFTDVTLSAEGRTLKAHRIILSACSTFFLNIFRSIDTSNHPIIIIPGASFDSIVALLNFMYSGEVNVYEEQIPLLLSLAETLGVKGLTNVQNDSKFSNYLSKCDRQNTLQTSNIFNKILETSSTASNLNHSLPLKTSSLYTTSNKCNRTSPTTSTAIANGISPSPQHDLFNQILPLSLENLIAKSLQVDPNLLAQPFSIMPTEFSRTPNKITTNEMDVLDHDLPISGKACHPTLQNQFHQINDNYMMKMFNESSHNSAKRICPSERKVLSNNLMLNANKVQNVISLQQQQQQQQQKQKDNNIKRIDQIVENLKSVVKTNYNKQHLKSELPPEVSSLSSPMASPNTDMDFCDKLTANTSTIFNQHSSAICLKENERKNSNATATNVASTTLQTQLPTQSSTASQQCNKDFQKYSIYDQCLQEILDVGDGVNSSNFPNKSANYSISMTSSTPTLTPTLTPTATLTSNTSSLVASGCDYHHYHSTVPLTTITPATASTVATMSASVRMSKDQPSSLSSNYNLNHHNHHRLDNVLNATKTNLPTSKLYATCFICHKQLSNQYNLRVHLETHQNIRYACNVCSHISRSKDALRKHISYRHPSTTSSSSDTESRRKKSAKSVHPLMNGNGNSNSNGNGNTTQMDNSRTKKITTLKVNESNSRHSESSTSNLKQSNRSKINNNFTDVDEKNVTIDNQNKLNSATAAVAAVAAAQLSTAYMFLPNQLHMAAVAAVTAAERHNQLLEKKFNDYRSKNNNIEIDDDQEQQYSTVNFCCNLNKKCTSNYNSTLPVLFPITSTGSSATTSTISLVTSMSSDFPKTSNNSQLAPSNSTS